MVMIPNNMNTSQKINRIKKMKIAIVHDYLHVFGGAESVANAIYEIFPEADVYSATYDRETLESVNAFKGATVNTISLSFLKFPLLRNLDLLLKSNLPIAYPLTDLKKYDLVLSSTSHFAKWIFLNENQQHVSYIHTPPRFLINLSDEPGKGNITILKPVFYIRNLVLKIMDKYFSKRIDHIICNSNIVKKRISDFYNRNATVIYPFAAIDTTYTPQKLNEKEYYLLISRLSAEYKNVHLAINAAISKGFNLKIIGKGKLENELKKIASEYNNIEFLGFVSQEQKIDYIANAKGMICPAENEDLGMTPLEAMWYGIPVIAMGDSGYLETVQEGETGVFFYVSSTKHLIDAIDTFENTEFNKNYIINYAKKFSKERFQKEYLEFLLNNLKLN